MQFVYCRTKGTGSTGFRVLPLLPPTNPTSPPHLDYFLFLLRVSHLFVLCSFGLPLLLAHPSPLSFHSLIFSFLFFFHFIFPSLFVPLSYSVFLFFQVLAYWLFIASGANGVLNALKTSVSSRASEHGDGYERACDINESNQKNKKEIERWGNIQK